MSEEGCKYESLICSFYFMKNKIHNICLLNKFIIPLKICQKNPPQKNYIYIT